MFKKLTDMFVTLGDYVTMIFSVIWLSIFHTPSFNLIRNQMYEIGVLSLPVVAFTGFSTGMVLAAQSYFQLQDKGLEGATGLMVTKAMLVELGPVLTAFMVTGRVGAAMCAELGTMRVTEQIDAIRSMSVNPLQYLVAPRFISGTMMLPILTIFSCVMGVIGGYFIAVYFYKLPHTTFMDPLRFPGITIYDFFSGFIKAFVFGIIIITISCYRGMITRGGAAGVGKATTNSVVICYSAILLTNFFMTVMLNGFYPYFKMLFPRWV